MARLQRAVRSDPPPLPDVLKGESPLIKFFWSWLDDEEMTLSTREIAQVTGVSQPAVNGALLRLRELGFLEYLNESAGSAPPTFRAVGERPPR